MKNNSSSLLVFANLMLLSAFASAQTAPASPTEVNATPAPAAPLSAPAITPDQIISKLKITNGNASSTVKRVVLTSCNVLFGYESSADARTQAGFGQPTAGRVEAISSSKYSLLGVTPEMKQEITANACKDANDAFAAAGLEVVSAEELTAHPKWKTLVAYGRPTPYEWNRQGSKYTLHTPPGYSMMEMGAYASMGQIFSSIGNASAADGGPTRVEAELLKALNAASVRVNILVDFAKQESNTAKGFFGRIAGNDNATVKTKVQLSISSHVTFFPLEQLRCFDALCFTADTHKIPQYALATPIQSTRDVVLEMRDTKSTGSKVGEAAVNVLGVVMALSGYRGTSVSSEEWGVVVDPALYATAVREHASALATAVTTAMKKS